MNTSLFRTFILGSFVLLLFSCGTGTGGVSTEAVHNLDSLLTIQAGRLMIMQSTIEINEKAMEMPFFSTEKAANGESIPLANDPLEGFSEERLVAFKNGFVNLRKDLDGLLSDHTVLIEEVVVMQKQLSDAQAELKESTVSAETKSSIALIPDQITSLQKRIDLLESKIQGVQKNAINLLMSEKFLQRGASWLMVNSPMI